MAFCTVCDHRGRSFSWTRNAVRTVKFRGCLPFSLAYSCVNPSRPTKFHSVSLTTKYQEMLPARRNHSNAFKTVLFYTSPTANILHLPKSCHFIFLTELLQQKLTLVTFSLCGDRSHCVNHQKSTQFIAKNC
jgi:hypothetical protein